ncbi:hypothetical protein BJX64DRAFT_288302 [Aspergillus heterothallicus]
MEVPQFSTLPLNPTHPTHSAWDVWGTGDQLGTLNHLTPQVVVQAKDEIRSGIRIGLNWALQEMRTPPAFRTALEHRISTIEGGKMHDDTLCFNTQTSSQWDGFRHCGYDDGRFYGGITAEEIRENKTNKIGVHAWCQQGIVGRGVLVDFAAYAASENLLFDALGRSDISLHTIKRILERTGTVIRPGDILVIRTGFLKAYKSASDEEIHDLMGKEPLQYPGVENSKDLAEWLWDSRIAAVCCDCPGFEAMPPRGFFLHPVLLAGFGMPIGELFDLERLSEYCEASNRWTFFFTSEPLNVIGGVASPPNALAIF